MTILSSPYIITQPCYDASQANNPELHMKMDRTPKKPEQIAAGFQPEYRAMAESIFIICQQEYPEIPARFYSLFTDTAKLYAGLWPSHEACSTTYHNFTHTLDVCLAASRMIAGWNREEKKRPMAVNHFMTAMAAALFHDTGYIRDKGDLEGLGGKFTLTHVRRSMENARTYLARKKWKKSEVEPVAKIISITDYAQPLDIASVFETTELQVVAKIVVTADLIAQIAAIDYVQRIDDLFLEFQEAYRFEGRETLDRKGVTVYESAQEIRCGTVDFYDHFVLPVLNRLDRMDRYLDAFFSETRNPYQENIRGNLAKLASNEACSTAQLAERT